MEKTDFFKESTKLAKVGNNKPSFTLHQARIWHYANPKCGQPDHNKHKLEFTHFYKGPMTRRKNDTHLSTRSTSQQSFALQHTSNGGEMCVTHQIYRRLTAPEVNANAMMISGGF